MKRERSVIESRRKKILEMMENKPEVRVDELSEILEVSPITIRRDLQYLEDNKQLVRFYGGAAPSFAVGGRDFEDEVQMYRALIARYAASLVQDEDTIFINTSSTALQLVDYLKGKHVTVITNNGKALYDNPVSGVNIILTGGELRHPKEAMVGDFALRNLQTVYAKKTFIGCSGFSLECGMTTENANEVNINQLMAEHSLEVTYILADHTKIGKNSSFISCDIDKVTNLITDEKAPAEICDALRERGITVHQVSRADGLKQQWQS